MYQNPETGVAKIQRQGHQNPRAGYQNQTAGVSKSNGRGIENPTAGVSKNTVAAVSIRDCGLVLTQSYMKINKQKSENNGWIQKPFENNQNLPFLTNAKLLEKREKLENWP